ncbi:hypothetical protein RND71_018434 [Anisodus tanguticus]|uniref:Uncharacterized protein n=1 Tax=Anisodus tanguticus TaxID=243964 RepID=A0AAE1S471_9SOLA|nr:hypothetical protein RND71_018434 [Anisodus tanguticus]
MSPNGLHLREGLCVGVRQNSELRRLREDGKEMSLLVFYLLREMKSESWKVGQISALALSSRTRVHLVLELSVPFSVGFVKLTLTYTGATPEVLEIPTPGHSLAAANGCDEGSGADNIPCELVKIEFPAPKIVNENERMVTEYYAIPCTEMDSQSSEHIDSKENGERASSDNVEVAPESVPVEGQDASEIKKLESPALSASAKSSPSNSIPKSSPSEESVLPLKDSKDSAKEVDSTSPAVADSTFTPPVVSVSIIPEQKVVQQDFIDLYMKSMQQFTEALEKMKLPLDIENGSPIQNGNDNTESSSSSERSQVRPIDQSPECFMVAGPSSEPWFQTSN